MSWWKLCSETSTSGFTTTTESAHQGYRNMRRRPIERIEEYLENVRKEG
jgi:hypothetical protein